MKEFILKDFYNYINILEYSKITKNEMIFFRGQSENQTLLPSIARKNPKFDTVSLEKQMMEELKRRAYSYTTELFKNDWDWITYAQHYGMKTRLLDWTTNPLVALWFACQNEYFKNTDSYVYILTVTKDFVVDKTKQDSPFNIKRTSLLKPNLNNKRLIAQGGWFTVHRYSDEEEKFIELEKNKDIKTDIMLGVIPAKIKAECINKLHIMGINHQSLFPEISGVCQQLNWEYDSLI